MTYPPGYDPETDESPHSRVCNVCGFILAYLTVLATIVVLALT